MRTSRSGGSTPRPVLAGSNTTIGVIATDAVLTKSQACRLATVGHDGLARAINPLHTLSDGDALFALGTGASGATLGMMTLCVMAAEVCTLAVVRAIRAAQGVTLGAAYLPAAGDLG
ncbi:P1 family peptidase [Sorangium sp. KYC3313]|uniref:P1 family peptidase n=1 Tax=Sorangium sp. KYC3313 TaxID=3449740 RepID=UPI003F8BB977